MKKTFVIALAVLALASRADKAFAEESPLYFHATVVEDGGPCNYFMFEIERGEDKEYGIVEWMGMDALEVGDKLLGRFEGGPEEIRNLTRGTTLNVWEHDFFLSYGLGLESFFKSCQDVFGPSAPDGPSVIK